ncbi:TcdA/TcdB pore-forming domain-containing protein [Xenorhabdus sp. XENO-7]|uniref:TcdA/TcdB pore-forming domain-containing protein n=1 Tax=Xenorhabdus aichiensis TaxID=3025874 RepID=A0ABT5LZU3_9GAMM|nr:TcdA/TcdB pore-forming domain-containing protein [Xenorhabdus aichiensis]MDC9620245.1 TcdA/TcdB pore-forming domain-containing protein [Xenorhabdus aichiensis]
MVYMSKDFKKLLNTLIDRQIEVAGRQTEWFNMNTNARADYIRQVNERLQEMQQSTLNVLAAQHFQMQDNPVSVGDQLQTLQQRRQQMDGKSDTPAIKAYKQQLDRDIRLYSRQQAAITHFNSSRKKALDMLSPGGSKTLNAMTLREDAAVKQAKLDTEIKNLEQQLTMQVTDSTFSPKYVRLFSKLQAYKDVKARYIALLDTSSKEETKEAKAFSKLIEVPLASDDLPVNVSLLMMEERPGYIRMNVALVNASPDGRFKDFFLKDGRLVVPKDGVFNFSFGTPARSLAWQQQYRLKSEPPSFRSPTYAPIRSVLVKIEFVEKYFANYLVSESTEREGFKEHFLDNDRKILLISVDRKVPNQIGIKVSGHTHEVPLAGTLSDLINQNADITSFQTIGLEDFRQNSYDLDRDGLFINIHELERSVGFGNRQYLLEIPQGKTPSKTYLSATPFGVMNVDGDKVSSSHLSKAQTAELYQYNAAFFEKLDRLRDDGAKASRLFEGSSERKVFEQQLVRLLERNHITPAGVLESEYTDNRMRDIKGNNLNKVLWEQAFATSVWEHIDNDPLLSKLANKLNSLVFSSTTVDKILKNSYVQSDIAQVKGLLALQYEQWRIQATEEETQRINRANAEQHPNNPKIQVFNQIEVERSLDRKLLALLLVGPENFERTDEQLYPAVKAALLSNEGRSLRKQVLFHVLRPVADSFSKLAVPVNPHAELMSEKGDNKVIINNRLNQPDPFLILNTSPEEQVYHDGSNLIKDDKYRSYNQFRPDPENKATRYMNDLDTPFVGGISGTTQTVSNVLPELFGDTLSVKEYWNFQMANAAFMIRNGYHSFFETFYVAARYEPKSADSIGKGMLQMFDEYRAEGREKALQGELYDGVMAHVLPIINQGLPEAKKFYSPRFMPALLDQEDGRYRHEPEGIAPFDEKPVSNWEKPVVEAHHEGGMSRFDGQLIIQLENDPVVREAAAKLVGKHTDSVLVQLDARGQYQVVHGDLTILKDKEKIRWQLVGHSRDGGDKLNHQTLAKRTPEALASQLSQFYIDSGVKTSPEHISMVSCSLAGEDQQKSYALKFAQSLDQRIRPLSVKAYTTQITVSPEGRKQLIENGNKAVLVFNPENSEWAITVTPGKSVPAGGMVNPPLGNKTAPVPDNVQIDIRLLEMLNRAEDFQQATEQLYSKNALSAEEWLPVLGSLREGESQPGSYSLQFINTARSELPPQTFTTDDRRIIDFIHSYDKDLETVSKTHEYTKGKLTLRTGIPEADAVHGLNTAFIVKTLIPWFADRNRTTVASDKMPNTMPNTLETALRVHTYVNLAQMAHGTLEDGAKLASLYRAVASEGRGVTSSLFSSLSHVSTGVGAGLNILSVALDGIELAHAQNESQKAVYGTQLAFDSAGLVTTGVGIGAGILGAPIVAGFASSLAVPLAGLGIGFTALAEAFGRVASDAQAVGNYFADLEAAYQQGGYRQTEKVAADGSRYTVMEPIPGAVIRQLDLRHGHLTFDSQYLYRNDPTYSWGSGRSNYFFWWPGRAADTNKKHAINIREGIGHKQAQVNFHFRPRSNDILILPVTMKSYINYEYMILPFVTARNDRGFDVLRRLEEDGRFDFDFYAFPGERVVRRIKPEFVATPIDIILDDEDRDIVIQQLPEKDHGILSYQLTGGKGKYRISLQEGVSLSLQGNTGTHWILDARHISSNVNTSLSKKDNRQLLHIGSIKITLPEKSDNISLINNAGIFSVKQNKENQWQITESVTDAMQFNSLQALHDHLRQLSNSEHHNRPYLVVEHYQHSPQSRPVGRAFYETGRDRMIYTNVPDAADFLSYAELAKVEGNKAWFCRDTTLWQVDIVSGEVLRQYLPIKFPGSDQEKISSHVMQGNDQLWFVVERQLDEGYISYTYQVAEEALKLVAVDGNTVMLAGLDKISEKNFVALPVPLDSSDGEFNGLLAPLAANQWFTGDLCAPERQVKGSPAEVISLSGRVAGVDRHYWLQTDGKQLQNVVRMNRINPDQEDADILAELKKKNPALLALTADFTRVFTTTGDKPGYYFYSHQRHSLYFQKDNGLSGTPASKVAVDDIRSVSIANKQLVALSSRGVLWLADDQGSIRLIGVTADWLQQPHQNGLTAALSQLARDNPDRFSTLLLLGLQDSNGKPISAWYDSTAGRVVQGGVGLITEHTLTYLGLAEDGSQAWIFDTDNHQLYRQPLSAELDLKLSENRELSEEPAAVQPWLRASHQYRSAVRQGNTLRLETPDGAVLLLSADAKMTDRPVLIAWHVQGRPDSQIASAIVALRNEAELPQAVRLFSEHGYPAWYLPEEGKTLRSSIVNSNHVLHYLGQVAGQEASYVHDQTTGELWQVSEENSTLEGNYCFVNRTPESLVLQVGQVPLGEKIRLPQLAGTDRLAITGRSKESYYWLSPPEALTHYRHITIDDRGQGSAIRFSDTCIANLSLWRSGQNLVLLHQASEDTSICIVSIEQAAQRYMRLESTGTPTLKKMKVIHLLRKMDKLTVLNPDVSCFELVSEEGELRIKPAERTEKLESFSSIPAHSVLIPRM